MDPIHKGQLLSKVKDALPDHQAVLHSVYDAVVHGRYDEYASLLTDDVHLTIAGIPSMDGAWKGREAVMAATAANFGLLDDQKPEVEQVISQGDTVAILLRETGIFKADARRYAVRGVQWFTFRDGRVSGIDEIFAPLAN